MEALVFQNEHGSLASFPTFRCFFATDLVTRPRMVNKGSYSICTVFNQDMIIMVSVLHQSHHDLLFNLYIMYIDNYFAI